MDLEELRKATKNNLHEYVNNLPDKQYTAYHIDSAEAEQHIKDILSTDKKCKGFVYVITTNKHEQVKIGYTDVCPIKRAKQIFPNRSNSDLFLVAFVCHNSRAVYVEKYVQRILYAGGLQSKNGCLGTVVAHSGRTEIFDIRPSIACAMIDDAVNNWLIT